MITREIEQIRLSEVVTLNDHDNLTHGYFAMHGDVVFHADGGWTYNVDEIRHYIEVSDSRFRHSYGYQRELPKRAMGPLDDNGQVIPGSRIAYWTEIDLAELDARGYDMAQLIEALGQLGGKSE